MLPLLLSQYYFKKLLYGYNLFFNLTTQICFGWCNFAFVGSIAVYEAKPVLAATRQFIFKKRIVCKTILVGFARVYAYIFAMVKALYKVYTTQTFHRFAEIVCYAKTKRV